MRGPIQVFSQLVAEPPHGVQRQDGIELVPQREVAHPQLKVGGVVVARVDQAGFEPQRGHALRLPTDGGLLVDPHPIVGDKAVRR